MEEARHKFIEAYIVEPYGKPAGYALTKWAKANNVQIGHPRIGSPNAVEKKDEKNITLTINNSVDDKDGRSAWIGYDMNRIAWQESTFKEKFPKEKSYRHTMQEEVDGLNMVIEILNNGLKDKSITKLDPAL